MSHQFQNKSDAAHAHNPHPEASEHDELRANRPNSAATLPASTIMRLQSTIGNQAVMRMLRNNAANTVQRAPKANEDKEIPAVGGKYTDAGVMWKGWNDSLRSLGDWKDAQKRLADDYHEIFFGSKKSDSSK